MRRNSILILALACFLQIMAPTVMAAPNGLAATEKAAKEIFAEIYSPFCPGRLLQDCPSSSATELKNKIKSDLAEGLDKETIINNLLEQYGSELGALPPTSGFSALAWIAPAIFLILGILAISLWLKTNRRAAGQELDSTDQQDLE
jgi:cytochrome c-type biogenesis protein CcmH